MAKTPHYLRATIPMEIRGSRFHFLLPNQLPEIVLPVEIVRQQCAQIQQLLDAYDAAQGSKIVPLGDEDD